MSIPYKIKLNENGSYEYFDLNGNPVTPDGKQEASISQTLPEVTITTNRPSKSAVETFVEDAKYNLNPSNYRFKDLSDPKTQQELNSLALGFGVPLITAVAPTVAPGTVGGTLLGSAAGGTAVGMGLEELQRAVGGKSVGDMASEGLQNIGVPQIVADFVRPEYFVDPLHVGVAGKSILNTAGKAIRNATNNFVKNTIVPYSIPKKINNSKLIDPDKAALITLEPRNRYGDYVNRNDLDYRRALLDKNAREYFNKVILNSPNYRNFDMLPYVITTNNPHAISFETQLKNLTGSFGKSDLSVKDPFAALGYNKADRNIINSNDMVKARIVNNLPFTRRKKLRRFINSDLHTSLNQPVDITPYRDVNLTSTLMDNRRTLLQHAREAKPGEIISAYYYNFDNSGPDYGNYSQQSLPLILNIGPKYGELRPNKFTYIKKLNKISDNKGLNDVYYAFQGNRKLMDKLFPNKRSYAKFARDQFEKELEQIGFPLYDQFRPRIYHEIVSPDILKLPSEKLYDKFDTYDVGFPYPEIVFKGKSSKTSPTDFNLTSTPDTDFANAIRNLSREQLLDIISRR